jgi:hypothetical protein
MRSSVVDPVNDASAIELPNTSWIQRIDADGGKSEARFNKSKVMTVPRAEHQPVIAELNRPPVTIDRCVLHIENGQVNAASR